MAQKSRYRKKIDYRHYGSSKRAVFLSMIETCSSFYIHKDDARENLSQVPLLTSTKNVTFSQIGKNNVQSRKIQGLQKIPCIFVADYPRKSPTIILQFHNFLVHSHPMDYQLNSYIPFLTNFHLA